MVKGEDGQMVECEIISTKDKESVFDKNAPVLPLFLAIICCILNIVPGKKKLFSKHHGISSPRFCTPI